MPVRCVAAKPPSTQRLSAQTVRGPCSQAIAVRTARSSALWIVCDGPVTWNLALRG